MEVARAGTTEILWRGEPEFERARAAGWNRRVPDRFPDVIVRPSTDDGVAEAVRLARSRDLRIAVRAGGHSMCSAALHDGGMLIDLRRLNTFSIDSGSRTARVQPAVTSGALIQGLAQRGLAFPVAHHGAVALGGFLLAGGLGWNVRAWGPACFSVEGLSVVTATGDRVPVDDRRNKDLLWAARGAGPNFFGVATHFDLLLHPLPRAIRTSMYLYPLADVEVVSRWVADIAPATPPTMEMLVLLASAPPGAPAGPAGKAVGVIATAFADTLEDASASLAILESCPALARALHTQVNVPATFETLQAAIGDLLPAEHRYSEDSFWLDQDVGDILPRLAERMVVAPSARSIVMAVPFKPSSGPDALPEAAFSMAGRTFVLSYGIWEHEAHDGANDRWFGELVADVEPVATGNYVAETNVAGARSRSKGSFALDRWQRLQEVRDRFDPQHVFHTYLEGGAVMSPVGAAVTAMRREPPAAASPVDCSTNRNWQILRGRNSR